MQRTQTVRCPNCGSLAQRHHISGNRWDNSNCPEDRAIQTECSACDYLLVTCAIDGRVIEAYAPGIPKPEKRRFWLEDGRSCWDALASSPYNRSTVGTPTP